MFESISRLWATWLLGLVMLVGGVALVAYHVRDIPYTYNSIGLGTILGLVGFLILMGTTALMIEPKTEEINS